MLGSAKTIKKESNNVNKRIECVRFQQKWNTVSAQVILFYVNSFVMPPVHRNDERNRQNNATVSFGTLIFWGVQMSAQSTRFLQL